MTDDILSLLSHTDLAVEAREMVTRRVGPNIPGVQSFTERAPHAVIHRTEITDAEGARRIGKQVGKYITLEAPEMRQREPAILESIAETLALELRNLLPMPETATFLIVGLGNWNVTPDALGPRVVRSLFVTRHLFEHMPEVVEQGMRAVSALSPGVLGITGVETGDIIKGVVEKVNPDCIICIDALAARSTDRLSTTVQVADTGIHPGSGVGNKRMAIDSNTMGVPVVAIGVPTVVHAVTLANDAVNLVNEALQRRSQGAMGGMNPTERVQMVQDILNPYVGALVVTPKEVDVLIEDIATVVAGGLNMFLHPAMSVSDAMTYQN